MIIRDSHKQFIKFASVGVINTMIDYSVFAALVYGLHWYYLIVNVLSFLIATTNSYALNRRWTFRSQDPNRRTEMIRFFIVNGTGLGINELVLFTLVDAFHLHKLIAKMMAVVVVTFWSFFGTKYWAFRRQHQG